MAARRLREQNKQRTLEHIKQVAKRLFEQKGYEATTTREIAEVAEIGTGTLFLYVKDKAELLLLVYADSIDEITANVFATIPEDLPLLDTLMHIFSPFFYFYEQHLENAHHFLKELLFHPGGHQAHQLFNSQKENFVKRLAFLVQQAQERGEVRSDADAYLAASSFHAMYFAVLTAWLGSFLLSRADTLDGLRTVFDLQIRGLLP